VHRRPVGVWGHMDVKSGGLLSTVLTTFWIFHKIFGLNPLPYHFVNVIIHAASAAVLWRVLRRLNVRGAWLGAALWTLHPVMVQSVAWITELKNTQSCLFYLLTILFFLQADKAKTRASGYRGQFGLRWCSSQWQSQANHRLPCCHWCCRSVYGGKSADCSGVILRRSFLFLSSHWQQAVGRFGNKDSIPAHPAMNGRKAG
jgi:hypothetical protein